MENVLLGRRKLLKIDISFPKLEDSVWKLPTLNYQPLVYRLQQNKFFFIATTAKENICVPHSTNRRHLEDFFSLISGDLENFYHFKTWWSFLRQNLENSSIWHFKNFQHFNYFWKHRFHLRKSILKRYWKPSFWDKSQDAFKNQYPLFASSAADT